MKPLARKNQLVVEDLAGECVVYDSNSKQAHSLNSTVTWIWHHCDGSTDVEEMALQFKREFSCADSLEVVLSGIQQLETAYLLVLSPQEDTSSIPGGPVMSRRAVVAVGSALVPVIASILVPTAAAAKSRRDKQDNSDHSDNSDKSSDGQKD